MMQRWMVYGLMVFLGVVAPLAGGLKVEVQTLEGEPVRGDFRSFEAGVLKVSTSQGEVDIPRKDILQLTPIRSTAVVPVAPEDAGPQPLVEFADGSRLRVKKLQVALEDATFESDFLGTQTLPAVKIKWIQFGRENPAVAEKWASLRERELKKDLLVIYKGESIDFVDGIIGGMTDEAVMFLLDGEEIPVKREKVFGIVFNRPVAEVPQGGWVNMQNGDRLNVSEFTIENDKIQGPTSLGLKIDYPLAELGAIDFRGGRLTYLSDLEPREEEYTPFFDTIWKIRRDRNYDGGPLRLGGRTYAKGLCIHSRTVLSYRLLGEYRRFQAWIGIDELVASRGDVQVVIKADDKVLFEGNVKGSDAPQRIDADVTGVKNLDILVDFGGDLDISDHLDLADARLVK